MRKTIEFGEIDYLGNGRENCPVGVEIELRETNKGIELSVRGEYCRGQCLDEIAQYVHTPLFKEIYGYWKKYHLNGMHAGTPEQEKALRDAEAAGVDFSDESYKKYSWKSPREDRGAAYSRYEKQCNYLKSVGLYEVDYEGSPYKYGHSWLYQPIPEDVLLRIVEIMDKEGS